MRQGTRNDSYKRGDSLFNPRFYVICLYLKKKKKHAERAVRKKKQIKKAMGKKEKNT